MDDRGSNGRSSLGVKVRKDWRNEDAAKLTNVVIAGLSLLQRILLLPDTVNSEMFSTYGNDIFARYFY